MNSIIPILYELSLWLIAFVNAPKMLYQLIFKNKYRSSLLTRFGFRYPKIERKPDAPLIWIHAVSLGETKAVVSLARELKRQFPHAQLVISSITETGHAEAKRSFPFADYHLYLPFDFNFIVKPIVQMAKPDLVVLCETDFWFNFLRHAKKLGASIALVNGKISEPSQKRFKCVKFFTKRLLSLFDVLCLQNDLYLERFSHLISPNSKLFVTGNLKLDEEYPHLSPDEIIQWRNRLGIAPDSLVLTIGSTHHPEEQIFMDILKHVWRKNPRLKVILVPRHPDRFKEVASLLEREHISAINYTKLSDRTGKEQVILIDAMGMLRMCYQLSDIALVGGSYTNRVGGHNILEPCWYGKPVLFGPHMHTQVELVDLINQYQAGLQSPQQDLLFNLENWVQDSAERHLIGQRGLKLIGSLKGSTKRTLEALGPVLKKLNK